ncbi:MAG TPA: TlpA disulfide reductase family protein [Bryobacteraceae bacterium]|nr:TlpA disulfide reductase family protein [Bryobacteraceae bacterium]
MNALKVSLVFFAQLTAASAAIVADVRAAIARGDFALAEKHIETYRQANGVTAEMIEAHSWLGRGALAAKQFDKAEAYAAETRKLALEQLKNRKLDDDKYLPIALGASIEVQANVLAERGERSAAVAFLQRELEAWRDTSIRTRIQKNLNLLTLEGKPAPPLDIAEWLGPKPVPLNALKGRVVLLYFWAHWCPDCKALVPALVKLQSEYGGRGLTIVGPTQRYGYTRRGEEASPEEELKYIDEVRRSVYAGLKDMPVPVSEENFKQYGASTTPTLVLLDAEGIVRLYHPGLMSYEALSRAVESALTLRQGVIGVGVLPGELAARRDVDGDKRLRRDHGPDRPEVEAHQGAVANDPHARAQLPVLNANLVITRGVAESLDLSADDVAALQRP